MERKILLDSCRVFCDCAKIGQVKERAVLVGCALAIFGRNCMVQTITLYLACVAGVKRRFGRARARGRTREKGKELPLLPPPSRVVSRPNSLPLPFECLPRTLRYTLSPEHLYVTVFTRNTCVSMGMDLKKKRRLSFYALFYQIIVFGFVYKVYPLAICVAHSNRFLSQLCLSWTIVDLVRLIKKPSTSKSHVRRHL